MANHFPHRNPPLSPTKQRVGWGIVSFVAGSTLSTALYLRFSKELKDQGGGGGGGNDEAPPWYPFGPGGESVSYVEAIEDREHVHIVQFEESA
jgi:hypothetical protein